MKKIFNYSWLFLLAGVIGLASCSKQLDVYPTNAQSPEQVYANYAGYQSVLAKLYATLNVTGSVGPAGAPDIGGGLDEGSQVGFIRSYFNMQELPTDEAVVAWNDQTIQDLHNLRWTAADPFIRGAYARPIWNITLINEYIREATDAAIAGRGITGADAENIAKSRGEARFLRAFNYWVMLDLFGKSTFITEEDPVGYFMPREISRQELFSFIESELKLAVEELGEPGTAEYGRVDKGAAYGLLARLYLNANVYTGTPRYADAITYANHAINGGYTLAPNYRHMFQADNNRTSASEFLFVIPVDGLTGKSFANTTFLIHAPAGSDYAEYGANNGWFGYRATAGFAEKWDDLSGNTDKRAMFATSAFPATMDQAEIGDVSDFANGLHVIKYRNIRSDGGAVSDPNTEYADIDFPLIRLAEMYLIYAEATLRGGAGGDRATALRYINLLRNRAGAVPATDEMLNPQYVLDERARELYWEGHRRTDLIRFNQLTTSEYLWPWKGGISNGTAVDPKFNLFPIPAANMAANSNLTQNAGY